MRGDPKWVCHLHTQDPFLSGFVLEQIERVDQSMYLPLEELRAEIEQHGWEFRCLSEVTYEVAPSKAAYADRLRLRALSTFEH